MALLHRQGTAATTKLPQVPPSCSISRYPFTCLVAPRLSQAKPQQQQHLNLVPHATAEEQVEVQEIRLGTAAPQADNEASQWIPVCAPEDLPKGVRKEVEVEGRQVLLFWYRNQIYCIEARSPAEGAYSEGFIKAKFTQDYCIECPSTGSLFSLKDGSIVSWYPNNAVLRALTPQNLCRPMEVYPVKLTQEAVYVDVSNAVKGAKTNRGNGGATSSLENNNVFAVQPTVYFEGMDPTKESASVLQEGPATPANPATALVGLLATGIVGAAGTVTALYYENLTALAIFWLVLGAIVIAAGFNFLNKGK